MLALLPVSVTLIRKALSKMKSSNAAGPSDAENCCRGIGHDVLRSTEVEKWAVRVIQGMYSNARSHVWVSGQYSEGFGVGVGVDRGSVISLLLFIQVLEALLCDFHTVVYCGVCVSMKKFLISVVDHDGIKEPWGWGMDCACYPGHALQCLQVQVNGQCNEFGMGVDVH